MIRFACPKCKTLQQAAAEQEGAVACPRCGGDRTRIVLAPARSPRSVLAFSAVALLGVLAIACCGLFGLGLVGGSRYRSTPQAESPKEPDESKAAKQPSAPAENSPKAERLAPIDRVDANSTSLTPKQLRERAEGLVGKRARIVGLAKISTGPSTSYLSFREEDDVYAMTYFTTEQLGDRLPTSEEPHLWQVILTAKVAAYRGPERAVLLDDVKIVEATLKGPLPRGPVVRELTAAELDRDAGGLMGKWVRVRGRAKWAELPNGVSLSFTDGKRQFGLVVASPGRAKKINKADHKDKLLDVVLEGKVSHFDEGAPARTIFKTNFVLVNSEVLEAKLSEDGEGRLKPGSVAPPPKKTKPLPEIKTYAAADLRGMAQELAGQRIRVAGVATAKAEAAGRFLVRFVGDANGPLLGCRIDAEEAGPLRAAGRWRLTVEGEANDSGGTVQLLGAKVVKAERVDED